MKGKLKDDRTVVIFWKDTLESLKLRFGFKLFKQKKKERKAKDEKSYSAFVMSSTDSPLTLNCKYGLLGENNI